MHDAAARRIDDLTARAHRAAWSTRAIDWWALSPVAPGGADQATYIDTVSQLFHAAKAELAMVQALAAVVPEACARRFLATQASDVERHAQVYRGYLERLGDVAPIDPQLQAVVAAARAWAGPPWVQVAALHVVLAQGVLPGQARRIERWPCRLLRQINQRVAVDGARHASFGQAYLAAVVPTIADAERRAAVAWLGELWTLWSAAARGRDHRGSGLHPDAAGLAQAWILIRARLARAGLTVDDAAGQRRSA
ncbi:MAG: hypothetical protein R3B06_14240 [Kofleriaceae bacterium]